MASFWRRRSCEWVPVLEERVLMLQAKWRYESVANEFYTEVRYGYLNVVEDCLGCLSIFIGTCSIHTGYQYSSI